MHTWHWHTWHGLQYLVCDLLKPWRHGFFTRQFYPQSPAELTTILHPNARVFRVQQVHGNTVLSITEWQLAMEQTNCNAASHDVARDCYPQADGLITETAHQSVWTCSADCTPVLLGDEHTGQVVAVHAGWRGTAQKIVPEAIRRLLERGSHVANLRVALGPAIAGTVYQVGKDVAIKTISTITSLVSADETLAALARLPNSPILPDPDQDRVRLDVRRVIALQLEQLGLAPEQIAIAPYCTYQQPELFFSYRRDHQKYVQWSGIVSF
ncbi:MAG: peptidoglycan editing factor PgeF [Cyanobacteria bacterium]|nr:peptidoglycan editing factor PgeF [Cyanobacteriota bacterium]MDW8202606.1 peptidoglycan editing factor PgeF [Cyanobacteriota bacterium SKYGB_h_bin112]